MEFSISLLQCYQRNTFTRADQKLGDWFPAAQGGHFTQILDELRQAEGVDGVLIEGTRWDLGNMHTYIQCLQAQAQDEPAAKRRRVDS
ncbi:unnamed protein product [Durusdinium trenchii]|uniref:GHMP_kinases_N domain-containing protein n=2 Tax=Durusdinium trenchii TaxID=1381693 RepID=A0ABP0JEP7_9DINO